MGHKRRIPPRTTWAYGYRIEPPLTQARLRVIEGLLGAERSNAKLGARTWEGRFVVEEQVTHILVVSDSPDQQLEVNHKLEAELRKLDAGYSITPAVAMADHGEAAPPSDPPSGFVLD